jgi:hypothetical protein
MQNEEDFEALFRHAAAAKGPAYVEARTKLLAMDGQSAARARLEKYQQSPDLDQALLAIILLGRIEKPAAYLMAEKSIDGDYPSEKYSRGRIIIDDPSWRAKDARRYLGKDLHYLGMELLLKVRKYPDPQGMDCIAAYIPIDEANDARWNDLFFAATMDDSFTHPEQMNFAGHLVGMKEPRILPYYRKQLNPPVSDIQNTLDVLFALAEARDFESVPRIKEIALDKSIVSPIREEAVDSLVTMQPPDICDFLLQTLGGVSSKEKPLLISISTGLAEVGDARAVPALKRLLRTFKGREDVEERLDVKYDIEQLEARLAGKQEGD